MNVQHLIAELNENKHVEVLRTETFIEKMDSPPPTFMSGSALAVWPYIKSVFIGVNSIFNQEETCLT